jgi:hypothetical protein
VRIVSLDDLVVPGVYFESDDYPAFDLGVTSVRVVTSPTPQPFFAIDDECLLWGAQAAILRCLLEVIAA